jgi:hypothetical protein
MRYLATENCLCPIHGTLKKLPVCGLLYSACKLVINFTKTFCTGIHLPRQFETVPEYEVPYS